MLTDRKKCFFAAFLLLCTVFAFSQSGVADLTKRYLERANAEYERADYTSAYKTINAVLKLNENTGIPANVNLVATQIYSAVLENIRKTKDYSTFQDVVANLENYPSIADGSIQRIVKAIYTMQEEELTAKKEAAEKEERQEQFEMYKTQLSEQQKSQENFLKRVSEMNEIQMQNIENLGDRLVQTSENSARSNSMVLVAVLIICFVLVIVFVIVIVIVRLAAKASARQSAQFEETLRLVAGMQQTNNQLLLGNVTDLQGISSLRSVGSSRWGVDALPAPEMTQEEKNELKQLAVQCEELGTRIDQISKRKNNSKNVSELVYKLAVALGCNQNTSMIYFCASMVYDAGFLGISERILEKENMTDEERETLRGHVNSIEEYFDFVPEKYRQIFIDAATAHHENEDGTGYPEGKKGDEIPQIAKLIHVVESYNSLISRRNYKAIKDKESAIEELLSKPNMYDEFVVKALDSIL